MKRSILVAYLALAGLCLMGDDLGGKLNLDDIQNRLGIQVDYDRFSATNSGPMLTPNFQGLGSQDGNQTGLALVFGWRIGNYDTDILQHMALVPAIGFRTGTNNDSQTVNSLSVNVQGTNVVLSNATTSRQTRTRDTHLDLPLRYYILENGQLGDGFYLQGGVTLIRTSQAVAETVTGTSGGQPTVLSNSITYQKIRGGLVLGIGESWLVGNHHIDLGLSYQILGTSGTLPANSFQAIFQWSF
jgi:hypothetical protein